METSTKKVSQKSSLDENFEAAFLGIFQFVKFCLWTVIVLNYGEDEEQSHNPQHAVEHIGITDISGNGSQKDKAGAGAYVQHIIEGGTGGTVPVGAHAVEHPGQQGREQGAGAKAIEYGSRE